MGNGKSNEFGVLHGDAKLYAAKFDEDELVVIKKTWEDLAERNGNKGIDKDTFLAYFPLNGLLGERLFAQFDTKNHQCVDLDEFVTGLAIICRGSMDDKIHFLFNMYDVSHDGCVSKGELATLINQLPKDLLQSRLDELNSPHPESGDIDDVFEDEVDFYTNHDLVERAFEECDLNHEGRLTYEEFKMFVQRNPFILEHIESIFPYNGPKDGTVHSDKTASLPHLKRIANRASILHRHNSISSHIAVEEIAGEIFNHDSVNHSRRMSINRPESSRALTRTLSNAGEGVLENGAASAPTVTFSPALSLQQPLTRELSNHSLREGIGGNGSSTPSTPHGRASRSFSTHSVGGADLQYDGDEMARSYLIQAMECTTDANMKNDINALLAKYGGGVMSVSSIDKEVYHKVVALEDYLWKKGKSFLHAMTKRYYLLSGNCMYYYTRKDDVRPKGVVFITGSLVERIKDKDMEMKGFYGFELVHQDLCSGEHHNHDRRVFFCSSEDSRDRWVVALQHAGHVVPIEDDYVIGRELGRGRFSVVCECVNKVTGIHCAVKIIDKATIEKAEKELLRTEIAVLKLVNHPNIIRMEGLYETKKNIYIVMEMLKGGELFERIVGRPRFSEQECRRLLRPLLESVAYLHDLGIVHRDLKPENILCGEELEDLKIADFGLSKMVMPKEKMDAACGTLSYVAPEVLTMQGYGKEADLWSVGVIMFLLLCGKLPFDGDSQEIIRSTIQAEFKVNPTVWAKLSEDAKNLINALLAKSPKDRISAREALKHPFVTQGMPPSRRASTRAQSGAENPVDRTMSSSPSAAGAAASAKRAPAAAVTSTTGTSTAGKADMASEASSSLESERSIPNDH